MPAANKQYIIAITTWTVRESAEVRESFECVDLTGSPGFGDIFELDRNQARSSIFLWRIPLGHWAEAHSPVLGDIGTTPFSFELIR